MDIGFIGIGQMGKRMSARILAAGYSLTVHDLKKEAAVPLLEKGAKWADTPGDVVKTCRIVITSLPTPKDVEQVVYGSEGLISGWQSGDIYIDMSTNSPTTVQRIARDAEKMGVSVLDAPVSGGTGAAENGTLAIMVGGETSTLEKVRKLLETMGQRIFPVGAVGCGDAAKLVNNLIALACNSISAEGFVLGVRAGINPATLLEIIKVSTGDNWCARQYPGTTFKGNFEPCFKVSLALALGEEYGVPLPVGEVVQKDLHDTIAAGFEDKGVDAVILPLEKAAGVEVRV